MTLTCLWIAYRPSGVMEDIYVAPLRVQGDAIGFFEDELVAQPASLISLDRTIIDEYKRHRSPIDHFPDATLTEDQLYVLANDRRLLQLIDAKHVPVLGILEPNGTTNYSGFIELGTGITLSTLDDEGVFASPLYSMKRRG